MSIESMTIALHHSRATGTAKVVLLGIANHDGDGGAWPAIGTLVKYANVTRGNVQKSIARLEELGEIRRHRQDGGTASMRDHLRPNLYEITLRCPPGCDRSNKHIVTERQNVTFEPDGELIEGPWGIDSEAPRGIDSEAPPGIDSEALTIPKEPSMKRPVVRGEPRKRRPFKTATGEQLNYLLHMSQVIRDSGWKVAAEWESQILDGMESLSIEAASRRIDEWMGFYRQAGGGTNQVAMKNEVPF